MAPLSRVGEWREPERRHHTFEGNRGLHANVRTKGETPLHRAAAFGTEDAVQMLLDAGARKDARDAEGTRP